MVKWMANRNRRESHKAFVFFPLLSSPLCRLPLALSLNVGEKRQIVQVSNSSSEIRIEEIAERIWPNYNNNNLLKLKGKKSVLIALHYVQNRISWISHPPSTKFLSLIYYAFIRHMTGFFFFRCIEKNWTYQCLKKSRANHIIHIRARTHVYIYM